MGQTSILTPYQKIILEEFSQHTPLASRFYFTGGTALSEVYLQHRESFDLDFFSAYQYDSQLVFSAISSWSKKHNFIFESQFMDPTHIYILDFGGGNKRFSSKISSTTYKTAQLSSTTYKRFSSKISSTAYKLKVDFAYYPYKSLCKPNFYQDVQVDSKQDIATNKLLLVSGQRVEVKDFVDLYFLLKEFSVWDLIEGVSVKFNVKIEPFVLASDFLTVEEFTFLPRMLKPLTLEELKVFFVEEAKKLGHQVTA